MKKKIIIVLFALLLEALAACIPSAWAQTTNIYKSQAMYIYNFTKFVNWKTNTEEFMIGVYGDSEILTELQTMLKGKMVGIKPIQVKHLKSTADFDGCSIVYVAANQSGEIDKINTITRAKGILVVSEDDLADKGASISFVQINNKLRFKIKQQSIQDAGLQVSDMLLTQGIVE